MMTTPFSPQLLSPNIELERDPLRLVSRDFGDIYFLLKMGWRKLILFSSKAMI